MHALLEQAWVILAMIALAGGLGILHAAAGSIRNHHTVHDLRVRVNQLRNEHLASAPDRAPQHADHAPLPMPTQHAAQGKAA